MIYFSQKRLLKTSVPISLKEIELIFEIPGIKNVIIEIRPCKGATLIRLHTFEKWKNARRRRRRRDEFLIEDRDYYIHNGPNHLLLEALRTLK